MLKKINQTCQEKLLKKRKITGSCLQKYLNVQGITGSTSTRPEVALWFYPLKVEKVEGDLEANISFCRTVCV